MDSTTTPAADPAGAPGASPRLLSVVMPARNEAEGIADTVRAVGAVLDSVGAPWEIVVVDDGSGDGTFDRVADLNAADARVRGVRLSRGFGKEAGLLAGLRESRGDAVVTMDSDLQHPPSLIPDMVRAWRGGAKVVNAVKRSRGSDGLVARARAAVVHGALSRATGVDLHGSSDFKLLDRMVVDELTQRFPERIRFYRGLTGWVGHAQMTLPFDVADRGHGTGKWSTWRLIELAGTALVSFTGAPLRIVTVLGLATLLFAFVVGGEALWSWYHGASVSGFVTIILTLLVLGSFIMISLGIVGEYVAKVYDEVKARPPYLVDRRTPETPRGDS
ncbi:MAG: glycosyltransferase family 2 protein [Planctomycetes bacterium]|nr:glycosyltransferase family 2 protein [Planctomycetota bacterium]